MQEGVEKCSLKFEDYIKEGNSKIRHSLWTCPTMKIYHNDETFLQFKAGSEKKPNPPGFFWFYEFNIFFWGGGDFMEFFSGYLTLWTYYLYLNSIYMQK